MASHRNKVLDWIEDSKRALLWHQEDDNAYVESKQDAAPLIEWLKMRTETVTDDPDYKLVGIIPEATLNQAFAEGWFHDEKRWREWMAENPKFTTKWHR